MKMLHILAFLGFAMLFFYATNARADEWNRKTVLTFNQPVEIPGKVLSSGTYVFRRMDGPDPNVVQILNADETHVYATLLTVPDYKVDSSVSPVITFVERSAGSPEAIKEWFYPGHTIGQEFLYPVSGASKLEPPASR